MRATLFLTSFVQLSCQAEPADFTKGTVRVDSISWNHALFGHYDPDQMDSAPLQHVLLEADDIGFINNPFAPDVDTEKAFHAMSIKYGEEDIVYELDISENGFLNNETFAILQNGISKCKIVQKRRLAPALQPDDLRLPPSRQAQAVSAEESIATTDESIATTEDVDFLGGVVDIMFVNGSQIKLKNSDFIANQGANESQVLQDHQFSIKGRIVLGCECSHSHLEDTYIGLGRTRFAIRKLHAKCPEPVLFKEAPSTESVSEIEATGTDATMVQAAMSSSLREL